MALLPLVLSAALVGLLAPVSAWTLRWAGSGAGGCKTPKAERSPETWFGADVVRSLWTSGVAVAAFLLIWSMLNLQLKEAAGHYGYGVLASPWLVAAAQLIDLAGAAALFWWVAGRRGGIDFNVLWRVAFVCLALTMVSVAYLGAAQVAQVFASAAYEMADAIVWLTLADVVRHSTLRSWGVAAFGLLVLVRVPDWVGRELVGALGVDPLTGEGVAVGLVAMLVLTAFFLPHRSPGAQLLFAELGGGTVGTAGEGEARLARLDEVSRAAGLTSRERQVAELLGRGRSKQYIAETLYLSENTVRTYTRRMYAKLDIHSRQELQDLLESYNNGMT